VLFSIAERHARKDWLRITTVVILQSIPGRQNTGAIYVYRESLQAFFWLRFGDREDDLNPEDFQNALRVHRLVRLVADAPSKVHRHRRHRHRGRRRAAPVAGPRTLSTPYSGNAAISHPV
jgi:hypothetical protein